MGDRPVETFRTNDPKSVKGAEKRAKQRERRYLVSLRAVLATGDGRLVFWELIERLGTFEPLFNPNHALMSYDAGRQSVGFELRRAAVRADAELAQRMEREARDRAEHDAGATELAHKQAEQALTEE